ncbi:GNAT family N-acetyltransferase [Cohnella mopanensis]|uniref:GNAT family N-acetyltransferase n=1 Tax=Cohnella mopanensis TaxID=2911966 RepID=UPI001EF9539F|nr:GNAT family N-acetyltransferase [Cohnella mopanensis]
MIESDRLIFRKYHSDDLDQLLTMASDPDVMRYIGQGTTWTKEQAKESLDKFVNWYQSGLGLYIALDKRSNKMVGHSGLVPQTIEGNNEIEVGYWVVKDYWGQGYGLEQAKVWKQFGLSSLNKKRLVSIIQHGNIGSMKVAEKNGMSYEKDIVFNGKEVALYSVNQ